LAEFNSGYLIAILLQRYQLNPSTEKNPSDTAYTTPHYERRASRKITVSGEALRSDNVRRQNKMIKAGGGHSGIFSHPHLLIYFTRHRINIGGGRG
jgi:hypothetical protein